MVAPSTSNENFIAVPDVSLGLWLDLPPHKIPPGALADGSINMRVKDGRLTTEMAGYLSFNNVQLRGPVKLIDTFRSSTGAQTLILGDYEDLYRYDEAASAVRFITPSQGPASGMDWNSGAATLVTDATATFQTDGIKPGDYIVPTSNENELNPSPGWAEITAVPTETTLTLGNGVPLDWLGLSPIVAGNYTIRRTIQGAIGDNWFSTMFLNASPSNTDLWYATIDDDQGFLRWDGSSTFATYVDLGFTSKKLFQHKRMLLFGDITESGQRRPQSMRNSDVDFPEVADGTTGLSRELRISDSTDALQEFRRLGDNVVAYFDDSVNLLQFVGEPFVWVVRTVIPEYGLLAQKLVQETETIHEFISQDRAYEFNGVSIREFGSQVFRTVLAAEDTNRLDMAVSYRDEEYGETLWAIPVRSDADNDEGKPASRVHVVHYREQRGDRPPPILRREIPATAFGAYQRGGTATWDAFDGTDPNLPQFFNLVNRPWNDRFFSQQAPIDLVGFEDGTVHILNGATSFNGAAFTSTATFGRAAAWDGDYTAIVRRIFPHFQTRFGQSYTIDAVLRYFRMRDDETVNVKDQQTLQFEVGGQRQTTWKRPMPKAGRYVDLSFQHTGADQPWALDSFEVTTTKSARLL